MANQYYRTEIIRLGPYSTVGLSLIIFSLTIYTIALLSSTKQYREKRKIEKVREKEANYSTINDAIILLVKDYIAEREFNRQSQNYQQNQKSQDINESNLFEEH